MVFPIGTNVAKASFQVIKLQVVQYVIIMFISYIICGYVARNLLLAILKFY